jgi:proliferating cell nuclear antigen PCNA
MKITIIETSKKNMFMTLFHQIKNCTDCVSLFFNPDFLHIQGMDKSHVCLFDIHLSSEWFQEYSVNEDEEIIMLNPSVLYTILSSVREDQQYTIYNEDTDNLQIKVYSIIGTKGDFNKHFTIHLIDGEYELMIIPNVEYDADVLFSAKKIFEITSQMLYFGQDIQIKCNEEMFDLITHGDNGEMTVNIPIGDLMEFSINEGETINLSYSLQYISKICLTNKLSSEILFCISKESPMKIKYDLGNDSELIYYIAPKVSE